MHPRHFAQTANLVFPSQSRSEWGSAPPHRIPPLSLRGRGHGLLSAAPLMGSGTSGMANKCLIDGWPALSLLFLHHPASCFSGLTPKARNHPVKGVLWKAVLGVGQGLCDTWNCKYLNWRTTWTRKHRLESGDPDSEPKNMTLNNSLLLCEPQCPLSSEGLGRGRGYF